MVVDDERPPPDAAAERRVDTVLEQDERARLDEAEGEGVERRVGVRPRYRLGGDSITFKKVLRIPHRKSQSSGRRFNGQNILMKIQLKVNFVKDTCKLRIIKGILFIVLFGFWEGFSKAFLIN